MSRWEGRRLGREEEEEEEEEKEERRRRRGKTRFDLAVTEEEEGAENRL